MKPVDCRNLKDKHAGTGRSDIGGRAVVPSRVPHRPRGHVRRSVAWFGGSAGAVVGILLGVLLGTTHAGVGPLLAVGVARGATDSAHARPGTAEPATSLTRTHDGTTLAARAASGVPVAHPGGSPRLSGTPRSGGPGSPDAALAATPSLPLSSQDARPPWATSRIARPAPGAVGTVRGPPGAAPA
jgi:hypothetical protein